MLRQIYINEFRQGTGDVESVRTEDIPSSGLGEEALPGVRVTMQSRAGEIRVFAYVWRTRNVVAVVGSTNTLGDFTEQTTLDLAKKVDFRAIQGDSRKPARRNENSNVWAAG